MKSPSPHVIDTQRRTGQTGAEQRLLARLRTIADLAGGRIIAGFSGGTDSLALALLLARVAPVAGVAVTLVHVDHGVRSESAAEAEHALALAQAVGLPADVVRLSPVRSFSEEELRRRRYGVLAERCRALDSRLIAVAHQRDDQAETMLMHLLRGSGTTGAAAMAEVAPVPGAEGASPIRVWRPLLDLARADLAAIVRASGLEPIDDASNSDSAYRRNWLRREILPALQQRVPGAADALSRYAAIAAEEDALLAAMTVDALEATRTSLGLGIDALRSLPAALERRVIRQWLEVDLRDVELTFERVEAIREVLAAPSSGRRLEIGGGYGVRQRKDGGRWHLVLTVDGE